MAKSCWRMVPERCRRLLGEKEEGQPEAAGLIGTAVGFVPGNRPQPKHPLLRCRYLEFIPARRAFDRFIGAAMGRAAAEAEGEKGGEDKNAQSFHDLISFWG